ncbi:hypothetical protein BO78DRAFT_418840 [Aspergillus sclerotiicarbonarius CBS 121057]|uniref:Uncharacterized protein n=1 Tax=Aspergillus sclerotiicarbonarius (strain CBS 121057 / IBT 28362) TaxID=1448318 RepID=A0A319E9U9_ASPSB|nr:hypothetical protein BO78DRAFT_418840 [Aspergillus sclerotiicarbonarius CBS 121057]
MCFSISKEPGGTFRSYLVSPFMTQCEQEWELDDGGMIWKILMATEAWEKGCLIMPAPALLSQTAPGPEKATIVRKKWQSFSHLSRDAFGVTEDRTGFLTDLWNGLPLIDTEKASEPGRLLFYTQSLHLRLMPPANGYIMLQTKNGNTLAVLAPGSYDEGQMRHFCTQHPSRFLAVIAISISCSSEPRNGDLYKSGLRIEPDDSSDSDYDDFHNMDQFQVNLMVLDSNDGISRRLALAQTWVKTWADARPQFGTFVVE